MQLDLNTLFPPVPEGTQHVNKYRGNPIKGTPGRPPHEGVTTRWAAIYALELRGLTQSEIAQSLGMSNTRVCSIVNDERYIKYREEHLAALDSEFIQMKPLAFAALKSGLNSNDENTALRASEQWFKGAGFGGFAKDPTPQTRTTAEDVAAALLASVNVNVQVNVGDGQPTSATAATAATIDAEP